MTKNENNKLEYRNAIYVGGIYENARNGLGQVLFDNSEILLANWSQDVIQGNYILFGDVVRAFGTISEGRLQGFNCICSTVSSIRRLDSTVSQKTACLYGIFKNSKAYGRVVLVQDHTVSMLSYIQGKPQELIKRADIRHNQVEEFLVEAFPYHSIWDFQGSLQQMLKDSRYVGGRQKFITKKVNPHSSFYGFQQTFRGTQLGFVLRGDEIVSVGQHLDGKLEGLGRSFDRYNNVKDGVFSSGELTGIGAIFSFESNRYVFGDKGRQALSEGFNWPQQIIQDLRQEFHLRSTCFKSDFIDTSLATEILTTLKAHSHTLNTSSTTHRRNTETFKSKSPLRSEGIHEEDAYKSVRYEGRKKTEESYESTRSGRAVTMSGYGYPREFEKRMWKNHR